MRAAPTVTQAYTDWLESENHDKATAEKTPFRFSGVMGCPRAAGYEAAGVVKTNPMDGPSLAITSMGSLLHEDIQSAYAKRWPNAVFESKGAIGDLISGHIDIDDPDNDEAIEIKTVGAFKFDMSIGLNRAPGKGKDPYIRKDAAGPSIAHICQGGFNARAHRRSKVRIVYISREAVAVKKAAHLKMSSVDRFAAEWVFEREVWYPLVTAEMVRLETIRAEVVNGYVPDRGDISDFGKPVAVDINTHWRCDYCPYLARCMADGPGRVKLNGH